MERYDIEEWNEAHPQWKQLEALIRSVRQEHWALRPEDREADAHMLVAVEEAQVLGFLKFVVQPSVPRTTAQWCVKMMRP